MSPLAPHRNKTAPKPATTAGACRDSAGTAQPKATAVQADPGVPHAVTSKKSATRGISGAASPLSAASALALPDRGTSTKTSRSPSSSTAPSRAAVYAPPAALTNGAPAPSGRIALALPAPLQAPEVDDVGDGEDGLAGRLSVPSPSLEAGQTADGDAAESEQDEDEDVEDPDALEADLIACFADEKSEEPSQPTVADENKLSDGNHAAEQVRHQLKTVGSTDDASVIGVGVSGDAEHEAGTAVEAVAGSGQPDDDADVVGQKQDDVKKDDATAAVASTGTTQAASGTASSTAPSPERDLATTHTTLSVPAAKPVGAALPWKTGGSAAWSLLDDIVAFALSLPGQDQNNT
jgi:hypothetical protein